MENKPNRNKHLFKVLKTKHCTLNKVRSVLKNHPIIGMNDEEFATEWMDAFMENPLLEANRLNLSTEIMQELINQGANANQAFRLFLSPCYMILAIKHSVPLTTETKLLLKNGVNANAMCPNLHPLRTTVNYFACDYHNWNYISFLPIIQLLLSYAGIDTKTDAMQKLFINVLEYIAVRHDYDEEDKCRIKNAIETVKNFIQSGARPQLNMFKRVFKRSRIAKDAKPLSKLGLVFLKQLCELPMECIILTDFKEGNCMESYLETMNFDPSISSNKKYEKLFVFVKLVWNSRFKECEKMKKDNLKNHCSLWQSVHDLCTTELHITNERIYEIMYKFSHDEYRQSRRGLCHTAKNVDLMDFYEYIWFLKQYSGNVYLFHPDSFNIIIRYLSKEDAFNYIFAILLDTI